jgi:replicative DNA helicase
MRRKDTGLPASPDAERYVLGAILLDGSLFATASGVLDTDDFSLDRHKKIYARMGTIQERGECIDRITVATELQKHDEIEGCGGLSYLVSLDDGLPATSNIDSYVGIVKKKSALRRIIIASQKIQNRAMLQEEEPTDIIRGAEATFLEIATGIQQHHGEWLNPEQIITQHPGGLNAFLCPPAGGVGVPTPWKKLTEKTAGLHSGHLFLVAGRPSMGKSALAMQIAQHVASLGHGVGIISLEETKEAIILRMIASRARVDHQLIRAGSLTAADREKVSRAASEVTQLPLWIDDSRARTMSAVNAVVKKLATQHKIRFLIVDHLQRMKGSARGSSDRRTNELGEIAHEMKYIAQDYDCTMILCSQLNRQCEIDERRPQLSDLKETGSLEEAADEVLFVHRPERYAVNYEKRELRGVAELILAKQRDGPTGTVEAVFLKEYVRFEERAAGVGAEPPPESPVSDDLYAGF